MLLDGKSGVYLIEIDGADWVAVTGPHGTSLAPKDPANAPSICRQLHPLLVLRQRWTSTRPL